MKRLLFLACFLFAGLAASAQDDGPPGDGGPAPGPGPGTNVPIDGGASILLASGVAYGMRHLRQRRKTNTPR